MKLVLGVLDVPYTDEKGITTGDVADILEAKYGILGAFVDRHGSEISDIVANRLEGELDRIYAGQPPTPFSGMSFDKITIMMRRFLETREIEGLNIEGVPTQAAIDGINHRFKNPRTGVRRPSFIDTGLMVRMYSCVGED